MAVSPTKLVGSLSSPVKSSPPGPVLSNHEETAHNTASDKEALLSSSLSSSSSNTITQDHHHHHHHEHSTRKHDRHLGDAMSVTRDSLFSSQSGFDNFRGLYNLVLLGFAVTCIRIAAENFSKYGLLIQPFAAVTGMLLTYEALHPVGIYIFSLLCSGITILIERLASRGSISIRAAVWLHGFNIAALFLLPCADMLYYHPKPVLSFLATFINFVIFMKLISYVDVNQWHRVGRLKNKDADPSPSYGEDSSSASSSAPSSQEQPVTYPDNLTIPNMVYFLCAPTLCYELNFSRNERVRKRFVMRRSIEVVVLALVIIALIQQWIFPTVTTTFDSEKVAHMSEIQKFVFFAERSLKLAVPNNIIWLLLFFMFFHSYLNLWGEVLRYGDREFYRDWWNATSVADFWRSWNMPVHRWAIRHLYRPLRSRGWTKLSSQIAVFVFSAVLHELLVCIPLRLFQLYSFLAMAFQIPLVWISEKYLKGTVYGNIVMWSSLFLGQPVAILLYVQAYMASSNVISS